MVRVRRLVMSLLVAVALVLPALPAAAVSSTTLSIRLSRSQVAYDGSLAVKGKLARRSTGAGIGGKAVTLWAKPPASKTWARLAKTKTSATGRYRFNLTSQRANRRFQTRFAGSATQAPKVSSSKSLSVTAPLWGLATDPAGASAVTTETRHWTGRTAASLAGSTVQLQRNPGSGWSTASTATVASDGSFDLARAMSPAGYAEYRVYVPATARLAPTTSAPEGITSSIPGTTSSIPGTTSSVPGTLQIQTTSLVPGNVGAGYYDHLRADGGSGNPTWSVVSGSLPAGLALSAPGDITGTPTQEGTSSFTVKAVDGQLQDTRALQIVVSPAPPAPVTITTTTLPAAVQGAAYSKTLAASGGQGALTWSLLDGSLPGGVTLSSSGLLSGTPVTAGSSTFTVQVADEAPGSDTQAYTLSVAASPSPILVDTAMPQAEVGVGYAYRPRVAGGTAPYSWQLTAGSLPPGLTLNALTGLVSGTPSAVGSTTPTIKVTDADGDFASKALPLSVAASSSWSQSAADPAHSSHVPGEKTITPENVAGVGEEWSLPQAGYGDVVHDGAVYMSGPLPGSNLNGITVRDISTGQVLWTKALLGPSGGTLSCVQLGVTADAVLCNTQSQIVAVSRSAQHPLLWDTQDTDPGATSYEMVVAGGYAVVRRSDVTAVTAYNLADGNPAWTRASGGTTEAMSVGNGLVYVVVTGGDLKTFTLASSGSPGWSVPGAAIKQVMALPDRNELVTVSGDTISWRSSATGAVVRSFASSRTLWGPVAADSQRVYASTAFFGDYGDWHDTGVTAVGHSDAVEDWWVPTSYPVRAGLAVGGDILWVHASDLGKYRVPSELLAVTTATGAVAGTFAPPDTATTSPIVGGGRVLVRTLKGGTQVMGVMAPAPSIPADVLSTGWVGTPFSAALTGVGGTAPYTWTLMAGSLPPGLTLGAEGVVTGTPTTPGTATFTVRLTDKLGRQTTRQIHLSVRQSATWWWSTATGNTSRSAFAATESGIDPDSLATFATRWRTAAAPTGYPSAGNAGEPVVSGSRLFMVAASSGSDGQLRAYDTTTGGTERAPLWTATAENAARFLGTPTLTGSAASGILYALTSDARLAAVNASDGTLLRSTQLPGVTTLDGAGSPLVVGNLAVVQTGDEVTAVDLTTGAITWSHPLLVGGGLFGVSSDGPRVFAYDGCFVVALTTSTGNQEWRSSVARPGGQCGPPVPWPYDPVFVAPVAYGGAVYGSNLYDGTTAFDAATGAVLWQAQTDATVPTPVVTEQYVVLANTWADGGSIYVLDRDTGEIVNKTRENDPTSDARVTSALTAVGDVVLFGSDMGRVRALDLRTMDLVWASSQLATNVTSFSRPVVAGGKIYAYTDSHRVVVLGGP